VEAVMGRSLKTFRALKNSGIDGVTDGDTPRHTDPCVTHFVTQDSPSATLKTLAVVVGATKAELNAATLAQWITKERPHEVHVRRLQREVRLPGLRSAGQIKAAAKILVDADWLHAPVVGFGAQRKDTYPVNPQTWGQ
jgi:hypothetical protein